MEQRPADQNPRPGGEGGLPGFFEDVLGRSISPQELESSYNIVTVADIDAVLERVKKYSDCQILSAKQYVLRSYLAIIKCPDDTILLLMEEALA